MLFNGVKGRDAISLVWLAMIQLHIMSFVVFFKTLNAHKQKLHMRCVVSMLILIIVNTITLLIITSVLMIPKIPLELQE